MNNCPKCGTSMKETTNLGITVEECVSCGYWHNKNTGEVKIFDRSGGSFLIKCPSCASKLRVMRTQDDETTPVIYIGDIVSCSFCNTDFQVPETPDPDLRLIVNCPHCSGKSRVPANRKKLSVTCTHCRKEFIHDTGTWPKRRPSEQQAYNTGYTQTAQTAASVNECYQCPKCGWTHPNTNALNEDIAKHTPCQNCGNSYLVHLTWDD